MPKLRKLSGADLVSIFKEFGFKIHNQKGSHLKLRRIREGEKETLVIPNHKQLDTGTTRAILRQATRYISLEELRKHFYQQ